MDYLNNKGEISNGVKKVVYPIITIMLIGGIIIVRDYFVAQNRNLYKSHPAAFRLNLDVLAQSQSDQTQSAVGDSNQMMFIAPIDKATSRITKKPFGIYVTPQNSPVQPERFTGYHTGTDFETLPEEQNANIPIYAITSGKIVEKVWASGYGGVLVESATINNQPVTIIYGHLNIDTINKKTGDSLDAGEKIGLLGQGYTQQTDGERKHLHLGIHKGSEINILGYVQNKADLANWIDPTSVLGF